jgi:hypothetical protein
VKKAKSASRKKSKEQVLEGFDMLCEHGDRKEAVWIDESGSLRLCAGGKVKPISLQKAAAWMRDGVERGGECDRSSNPRGEWFFYNLLAITSFQKGKEP